MYKQLKLVFGKLQDEQSRDIFMYKLRCTLDNDSKSFDYLLPPVRGGLKSYSLNFLKMMLRQGNSSKHKNDRPIHLFNFLLDYTSHKKIVIYGSGNMGKETYIGLKDRGINAECFCDSDKGKYGTECCGIPVISPETLVKKYIDTIVIISVWSDKAVPIIVKCLLENEFKSTQLVSTFDISDQYFCHLFFPPGDNEIYIDVGCLDGGSITDCIKFCSGRYRKIFDLEPDTANSKATASLIGEKNFNNVEIIPKGTWSTNTELHFTNAGNGSSKIAENGDIIVPVTKIDDVLNDSDAGNILIKKDVEGAELEALKGVANTIRYKKPRFVICIYHKPEDIIEIPAFLNGLVPEYNFFIQHCNPYNLTATAYYLHLSPIGREVILQAYHSIAFILLIIASLYTNKYKPHFFHFFLIPSLLNLKQSSIYASIASLKNH